MPTRKKSLINHVGDKYFKAHRDYKYISKNCGDYVKAMIGLLDLTKQPDIVNTAK